jgi:hypothetical protein
MEFLDDDYNVPRYVFEQDRDPEGMIRNVVTPPSLIQLAKSFPTLYRFQETTFKKNTTSRRRGHGTDPNRKRPNAIDITNNHHPSSTTTTTSVVDDLLNQLESANDNPDLIYIMLSVMAPLLLTIGN